MSTPQPRRWPRFSLRTIFVVLTLVATWLGWNLQIVRERQRIRTWVEEQDGEFADEGPFGEKSEPTLIRRLLGDKVAHTIWVELGTLSPGELDELQRAFPEAELVNWPRSKHHQQHPFSNRYLDLHRPRPENSELH
jgi:hypothetical protein